MFQCPVCSKSCKTQLALDGHVRLKNDVAHANYRGYAVPPRKQRTPRKRKPDKQDKELAKLRSQIAKGRREDLNEYQRNQELKALNEQNRLLQEQINELKQNPVQPERRQQTVQPVSQPTATVIHTEVSPEQQALSNIKQTHDDDIAREKLLSSLKKEMTGGVTHDHAIMDKAPESIKSELWRYHLYEAE